MTQYTADFSGDTVGLAPTGWTELDGAATGSPVWVVASDVTASGAKTLELTGDANAIRYFELDSSRDGNTGAMDVRVRFKTPTGGIGTGEGYGLCAVYYENDVGESSEMIRIWLEQDDEFHLGQFYYFGAPGAYNFNEQAEFAWTSNTWYQARLKVDPTTNTAYAKVWNDNETEPGTWLIEKTDPGIIGPRERSAGLYTEATQTTFPQYWDHLIVDTDGTPTTEAGLPAAAEIQASQLSAEVLYNFRSPQVRVSQLSLEVLVGGSGDGSGGDGGNDGTGGYLDGASQPYIRAWGFTLDGHDYYVLNLPLETLVYDFHSGQWFNWGSESFRVWAALEGVNWYGNIGRLLSQYGNTAVTQSLSSVLVGDNSNGSLYFLDPTLPWDSDRTGDATYNEFERYVYGQIQLRGWDWQPCDSFQVSGSVGDDNPTSSATVQLEYSDDGGHTFIDAGTVTITEGQYNMRVEWPSLGSFQKPGRLFRITDFGALQRIDGMEVHEHGS